MTELETAEHIIARIKGLTPAQQQEVDWFISYLEYRDHQEAPVPGEAAAPQAVAKLAAEDSPVETMSSTYFPRDRGPGPWCEVCGRTMGMHGGEYICTSHHF